jgi:hypothetical protein
VERVGGIRDDLDVPVPVLQLEQVLEAVCGRAGKRQLEAVAVPGERDPSRPCQLVRQRDPPERSPRIGQCEDRPIREDGGCRRARYFCVNLATTNQL